ncbi:formyl-CoA transferase [Burkholderia sp. WAC0059]|uniref:CaiB/BaiF CoA transferase family protein n=1 Tax=Burkholderia sp. WAC0059 TaxID=2066022 RepID=UPI000C7EFDC1|nr:CoA transferase [Burkholderia sp. WAC0059]PLZ02665.1 formyl-CoA transferase [Burkholderia sp. WAC0059]
MMKPLSGIKVIDFTRVLAGPYCTMLLGDLGADVVKIESASGGDPLRHQGPPFLHGNGMTYLAANRNKRSLTLNLKSERGAALARRLCARADVLVENFRPDVMARLGLGYGQLEPENPGLIYASISGFGADGPDSLSGAFDLTIQALGGYMSITGDPEGRPIKLGTSAFDLAAGMNCQAAILAALLQRRVSGRGQKVETSLLESQVVCLADVALQYLTTSVLPGRHGAAHAREAPHKVFRTADGWLLISAAEQTSFAALVAVLERPGMGRDPRFADPALRARHRVELYRILDEAVRRRETDELVDRLARAGVNHARVNSIADALSCCRDNLDREMVRHVPGPEGRRLPQMASAVRYSGFDVEQDWTAPPLEPGEHRAAVLRDWLQMDESDIADLAGDGIIEPA